MTDLDQAQRFLKLLDPNAEAFTFQTFGEGKAEGESGLVRCWHDTLENSALELANLNAHGAGVFVTVNETDGTGRTKEDIIRVRAVWQDDDKGFGDDYPLAPSIVVQTSPGKSQRYWLIDGEMPNVIFTAIMERMVQSHGCDAQSKDLARVLRVPGFLHNKAKPHLVKLIEREERRYTRRELFAAFPPVSGPTTLPPRVKQHSTLPWVLNANSPTSDWERERTRLPSALASIPADDRDRWFRYGAAIYDASGGSDDGFQIWDGWSKTTKSKNYDPQQQQRYWKSAFQSDRADRTTLASIYRDAKENGWLESDQVAPATTLPTITLRAGYGTVNPSTGESTTDEIATAAVSALRETFKARGHFPSEEHWKGLTQIARAIESMVLRVHEHPQIHQIDPDRAAHLFVSCLPTGMGKTSALIETVRALVGIKRYYRTGVIIFLSRCEEIKRLAGEMNLSNDQFSVVVGKGREEFNQLGRQDDKTRARVMFSTQQMLEARSSPGIRFAEIDAFYFDGRPRQVRIWDEAILPSTVFTLGQYDVSSLYRPLSRSKPELLEDLKATYAALEAAKTGALIQVPDVCRHGVTVEDALALVKTDEDRTAVEALWGLSGRVVRVRKNKSDNAALDYEDILPPDLAPMLILDASGQQRKIYEYWYKKRGGLKFLHSPQKSYRGFTIHHWNRGAGKDAHQKDGSTIARGIAEVINKGIPRDERGLVVHFKPGGSMPDMAEEISKRVTGNKDRVSYLTWGRHTATNEYTEVKYVILSGVLQYAAPQIEAMGRSAKALKKDEQFGDDEFTETRLGEVAHHILQAATRGAVRKSTAEGGCPPGCHLYVVCSTNKGVGLPKALLQQVFPGADIIDWRPIEKVRENRERLIQVLLSLAEREQSIRMGATAGKLGMSPKTLRRILADKATVQALREKGVGIEIPKGRIIFSKVPSAPQDMYEGGHEVEGVPL